MSIVKPSTFAGGLLSNAYRMRAFGQVEDWIDLIEGLNFLYAHQGGRIGGYVFESAFVRPGTSTQPNYNTVNASGDFNLDDKVPLGTVERKLDDSGTDSVEIGVYVYGKFHDVRITPQVRKTGGDTALATITTTNATSNHLWTSAVNTYALSDVTTSGDPDLLVFDVEARSTDSSNNAEIYEIVIGESLISSTALYLSTLP